MVEVGFSQSRYIPQSRMVKMRMIDGHHACGNFLDDSSDGRVSDIMCRFAGLG